MIIITVQVGNANISAFRNPYVLYIMHQYSMYSSTLWLRRRELLGYALMPKSWIMEGQAEKKDSLRSISLKACVLTSPLASCSLPLHLFLSFSCVPQPFWNDAHLFALSHLCHSSLIYSLCCPSLPLPLPHRNSNSNSVPCGLDFEFDQMGCRIDVWHWSHLCLMLFSFAF